MSDLRAAICGLTPIAARRPATTFFGRVPISHAAGYAAHPGCRVVAVADLREDLITAFREAWGDTWPAVAGYTSVDHLLAEAQPSLLSVCTPDNRHAEVVTAAAGAGVRGILCETPLATTVADADRMLAAVKAAGAHLVVNHARRFDPLFHLVRDALRLGEIGSLRHLRCYHSGPRAMLFRNGVHAIDVLCFLADSPVVELTGRLEAGFEHWDTYRGDGGHDPASEPTATASLVFANGVTASYDGVRTRDRALWFDLIGSNGVIRLFERHAELVSQGTTRTLVARPYDAVGLAAAVFELADLVQNGGDSVSGAANARHVVEILEGILRSSHQGARPLALPLEDII